MHFLPFGTVYGTLLNFRREHEQLAAQMAQPPYQAPPRAPVLYIKTANTWTPHGRPIPVPARVPQVEIGATVGMVMQAANQVGSYVLMNDLSVPHASFFRPPVKFKCLDGFLGVGERAVPADQAGDPAGFSLQVRVNGQLRQQVDFAQLVRSAAQLLADVGEFMTLRGGDVLLLGCDSLPEGGRPLAAAGDVVEISAPGFPTLSNALVAQEAA